MGKSLDNKNKLNDLNGGALGSILTKDSTTDGDFSWQASSGAGGSGLAGLMENVLGASMYAQGGNIVLTTLRSEGGFTTFTPGSSTNVEFNEVYAIPISVVETMTFSRMSMRGNSDYDPGANDAFIRYIIWEERSPTDKRPGAVIFDSGSFELPTMSVISGAANLYIWRPFPTLTLQSGKQYWAGVVFNLTSGFYPPLRGGGILQEGGAWHIGNDNGLAGVFRLNGAGANPSFQLTTGFDSSDFGVAFTPVFNFQT